ncbi:TetR/AcrR family transcriptional regulator [Paracoccus liaowanqingii]|uniref:TetR/AcrR family transcriptional regulator n=1 Tax=Paracoccus liaowanqingii TaxID=2560053 RepID=A0A4Z1BTL1_9RHOB|nr:TetR/AcrR family transcriptional regulator [Paracoccus liaowanqingii]TGN55953.1 TetR/AcrR family transcriptional regulator [Paracoccus liaowanqingii]
MARPREFDEAAVLDASVKQFRVHGFAYTTTEQLCDAAGLRRSSLYNAFKSKEELFVRSLERHTSLALEEQQVVLTSGNLSGFERLEALFGLVLDDEELARIEGHAAGCMIVASRMAPMISSKEPRIQRLLDSYMSRQLSLVTQAVTAGCCDGSLRVDLSAKDAALMIVSAILGLRVMAQSGVNVIDLRKAAALHIDGMRARTLTQ